MNGETTLQGNAGKPIGSDPPLTSIEIKRNMFWMIMLDTFFLTGGTDFSLALTPFLKFVGASNTVFGALNGLQWLALPGTFISPWISRRFHAKKWYFFWTNVPQNLCIGAIGLMLLLSGRLHLAHPWMLRFAFITMATWYFLGGFVGLAAQEYIAATIPMSHRGRFSGISTMSGSLLGIAAAWYAQRWILGQYGGVTPYGILFMVAYVLTQSSFFMALFAKERRVAHEEVPKAWSKEMLRVAFANRPWLRVLLIYGLNYLVISPMWNFIPFYGLNVLGMPDKGVAVIAIINKVGAIAFCPLVGFLADRIGAKRLLPIYPALVAAAVGCLLMMHNVPGVYVCAGFQSISGAVVAVCFTVLMYGLPKPEDRAGHYTIQGLVVYAAGFAGNTGIGFMMDKLHYQPVLLGILAFALLMVPLTKWAVSILSADPKAYG